MSKRTWIATTSAIAVVAAYSVADVADAVPGPLTMSPVPIPPKAFPTAPGATPVAELDGGLAAPQPATVDVQKLASSIEPILEAGKPSLGQSFSVSVADAMTGDVLYSRDATTPRVPASVTKILVAAAALNKLGPSWQATTEVALSGKDRLFLRGGGDVMLAAGKGNPGQANGRAGLLDLAELTARSLKVKNITSVTLGLDESRVPGPAINPVWDASDMGNGYIGPVGSLSIDGARKLPGRFAKRHTDPALHTAKVFSNHLRNQGIEVKLGPGRAVAPKDAQLVAAVSSAPLEQVAAHVLRTSDNTMSEAMGRNLAVARGDETTFTGVGQSVLAELKSMGVDTAGSLLQDGCGIADGSRLTTQAVTAVLQRAADGNNSKINAAVTTLPVAGLQGTLTKRFAKYPKVWGITRAKTGTLRGVTALSGYTVTASGRPVVFTALADQAPSADLGKLVWDKMAAEIATCDCGS